jgi:hypothetical protein
LAACRVHLRERRFIGAQGVEIAALKIVHAADVVQSHDLTLRVAAGAVQRQRLFVVFERRGVVSGVEVGGADGVPVERLRRPIVQLAVQRERFSGVGGCNRILPQRQCSLASRRERLGEPRVVVRGAQRRDFTIENAQGVAGSTLLLQLERPIQLPVSLRREEGKQAGRAQFRFGYEHPHITVPRGGRVCLNSRPNACTTSATRGEIDSEEKTMKNLSRLKAILATVVLAAGAATIVVADNHNNDNNGNGNNNKTRLRTRLAGAAITGMTPEGNADFRSDSNNNRMRLNVEVEHVNAPAGTSLDVSIQHGTSSPMMVGHIMLSATGEGELELNSQDGATVPAVQSGDMVIVSNGGTAILTGVF